MVAETAVLALARRVRVAYGCGQHGQASNVEPSAHPRICPSNVAETINANLILHSHRDSRFIGIVGFVRTRPGRRQWVWPLNGCKRPAMVRIVSAGILKPRAAPWMARRRRSAWLVQRTQEGLERRKRTARPYRPLSSNEFDAETVGGSPDYPAIPLQHFRFYQKRELVRNAEVRGEFQRSAELRYIANDAIHAGAWSKKIEPPLKVRSRGARRFSDVRQIVQWSRAQYATRLPSGIRADWAYAIFVHMRRSPSVSRG